MILGGLVSVALFAWLYEEHQPAAFFLMPTRLWELGIGALVFLASQRMQSGRLRRTIRRLSPFALVALIVCFFAPESYAVPATLAAVGIYGIAPGHRRPHSFPRVCWYCHLSYTSEKFLIHSICGTGR